MAGAPKSKTPDRRVVTVILAARCTVSTAEISRKAERLIVREFTHPNKVREKLLRMGKRAYGEPRELCHAWQFPKRELLQVPRGGAPRLRRVLEDLGYEVRWDDRRLSLPPVTFPGSSLRLRPGQEPHARTLVKKQQGLLRGQTGTGKTETLLGAAVASGQPTLVIVWNKGLQHQWMERIVKYGLLKHRAIGGLGGVFKTPRHGKIAVVMLQSLTKYVRDWAPHYGAVILDEAHRAPATTYAEAVDRLPAKFRWGATADETRGDGRECLTYDCFGPVVAEIETNGTILEPTMNVVYTDYADPVYDENRDHTELVSRLMLDKKRNERIRRILRHRLKAGRRVLLFHDRVEGAMMWVGIVREMGFSAGPLIGGAKFAEETGETVRLLNADKVQFAAATSYADAALDFPRIDCGFVTCPTGGDLRRMNQQVGRIVRSTPEAHAAGKVDAEIWYFGDVLIDGPDRKVRKITKKWKKFRIWRQGENPREL